MKKTTSLFGLSLLLTLVLCLVCPKPIYSAEEAEKNYIRIKTKVATISVIKGEVLVTYETGESKTLKDEETEGSLPDGALISIVTGNAKLDADKTIIELEQGDYVLLFIDGTYRTTSIQVPSGYPRQIIVQSGSETQSLAAGETYWAPTVPTAKKETKTEKKPTTDSSSTEADEEKEDDSAVKPDISPIEDEDTIKEQRSNNQDDETPEIPQPPKRKPGSDSGQ